MIDARPILQIVTSIPKRHEDEFNDFYHHEYIPIILKVFPEIVKARRYEEYNTDASLRYYFKQWVTIYELESEAAIEPLLKALPERSGREKQKQRWKEFEQKFTTYEKGRVYTCRYQHPRKTWDGPFGCRCFFSVTVDIKQDRMEEFNTWYEKEFLPSNIADVATWSACRRYTSYTGSPTRQITIYESENASSLDYSLKLMRARWRMRENESWNQWDTGEDPVITWEDASTFMPVFCYPD
jgi:hypothetical protein